MESEPSFIHVKPTELDEGVEHARIRYPETTVDREKLESIVNTILEQVMRYGKGQYIFILRNTLASKGVQLEKRPATKAAIAKIMGGRHSLRAQARKRAATKKFTPPELTVVSDENSRVVLDDIGPLRPDEVAERIALYGFSDPESQRFWPIMHQ